MRTLRTGLTALAAVIVAATLPAQARSGADPLAAVLDSLRLDPNGATLTSTDVTDGARTIGPKDHLTGSVASWKGPLEIHGTVDGNAVAIGGDVIVGKGGRIRGDALSVGGTVKLDGGIVDGEVRTISKVTVGPPAKHPRTPGQVMRESATLAIGWYLVLACIGIGILVLARSPLESVSEALRLQPWRAFGVGLLGQLAIAPAFTLVVLALAITVIGLVVVPFAIVGFLAAVAGALALGFVAVAMLTGQAVTGGRNGDRSFLGALQPLFTGLSAFLLLWIAGTAFEWTGGAGIALAVIASAITWAAATIGFGAVLVTRAGTRAPVPVAQIAPAPTAEHEWQTPTPVSGVAAARRPTPAPRRTGGDR